MTKQKKDTEKNKIHTFKRLIPYIMQFKGLLFASIGLAFVSNILALICPRLAGYAIDALELGTGNVKFDEVYLFGGLMVIFYIISAVCSYFLAKFMMLFGKRMALVLRRDIFNHLMSLPVNYFDTHSTGDIVNRLSYDIDVLNTSLANDILNIFNSSIAVIFSFTMMTIISPVLVLVFVITLPITFFFTRYMIKKVRPRFHKRSVALGEMNGYVEQRLTGQDTIKSYNRERFVSDEFLEVNKHSMDVYYDADYHSCLVGPSVGFINNLALSLISLFGSILYLFNRISIGDISSFILYSHKFSGPINETVNIFSELQSALSAADRIFRLLDEEPEKLDKEDAKVMEHIDGNVSISNIKFGYVPDKTIISNMNLEVKKGQVVAIVGPTGAGKSTIINLLMRYYDPQRGDIKLDGISIYDMTRESMRKAYTMVLQETWLFSGTVADNIRYGYQDATIEEVIDAAKQAKIHNFIEGLPMGYDTLVSDDGSNISKGQKQLLTIARAMLSRSQLVILDEATSNVDSRTEIQIQEAMQNLMKNKTCFVIAHRLSTIKSADTILVFKSGEVIEQGSHDELIAQGGFYANLYQSQFTVT